LAKFGWHEPLRSYSHFRQPPSVPRRASASRAVHGGYVKDGWLPADRDGSDISVLDKA
jgi:hypothetical protein